MLTGLKTRHYIGRQAPVKRCLARLQGLRPAVLRLNFENELRIALRISAKLYLPYGSICLIAATSLGLTKVNFLSLRMRPERLVPVK